MYHRAGFEQLFGTIQLGTQGMIGRELRLAADQPDRAARTLSGVLLREPDNYPALHLQAAAHLRSGDAIAACAVLAQYDELFGGRSTLHDDRLAVCRAAIEPR